LLGRPLNLQSREPRLQLGDRLDMIGVMMGDEHAGQAPTAVGERGEDWRGFWRVNAGARPGRRVMQEDAIIVRQAKELTRLRRQGGSLQNAMARRPDPPVRKSFAERASTQPRRLI